MLPTAIQIPSERVPPIAKEVASSKQTWAILFWFVSALSVLMGVGSHDSSDSNILVGAVFWFVVSFSLGVSRYKLMRRANEAVRRAEDPYVTWTLAGRDLVAYTDRGVSIPEASIKLSQQQVTMLTALPKAELKQ